MKMVETIQHLLARLNIEFYDDPGVLKWQLLMNLFSDACNLISRIAIEKFVSIPKLKYPILYSFCANVLQTTNNILPTLVIFILYMFTALRFFCLLNLLERGTF
ncbi:unnamed protein product [Gongylonema pulchrum]|uniref:Transmembrane protein n=1 Tax=Gongylonema pulchrum TaxID=637853 RepID=A0A183EYH5_9BILA|nr:unnamed protein product [Gongylonema pulchrum]